MAMRTSHLIALLGMGFMAFYLGMPLWAGLGIILVAMAIAMGDDSSANSRMGTLQPAMSAAEGENRPQKPVKAKKQGSVNDPLNFRPSLPPDGIASLGSLGQKGITPEAANLAIGKRTGTASMYLDPDDLNESARIRIKDDLRVHMPFMNQKDENNIRPFQNLFTSHFRTGKPLLKTKALEPTFETWKTGFDEWAKEDD